MSLSNCPAPWCVDGRVDDGRSRRTGLVHSPRARARASIRQIVKVAGQRQLRSRVTGDLSSPVRSSVACNFARPTRSSSLDDWPRSFRSEFRRPWRAMAGCLFRLEIEGKCAARRMPVCFDSPASLRNCRRQNRRPTVGRAAGRCINLYARARSRASMPANVARPISAREAYLAGPLHADPASNALPKSRAASMSN